METVCQETVDGRRWPFGAAEERPPSKTKVASRKRGAREDRQGRRNDTARVEDDSPGDDVGAGSGETATPHRSKSKAARKRQVGRSVQCRQNRRGRTAVTWPLLSGRMERPQGRVRRIVNPPEGPRAPGPVRSAVLSIIRQKDGHM